MIALERLGVLPFFEGVSPELRQRLAGALMEQSLPAGHTVFAEGEEGDALYFIAEGRVAIKKTVDKKKGSHKILSILGPGDFFGEMALLEKAPRWASAITQTPTVLLSLPAEELGAWVSADAKVPLRLFLPVVQSLNARLRQSTREMILLFDVGGLLAQNLDAPSLAVQLVEVLTRGFDDPVSACFYLWNEFSAEFELVAPSGTWPGPLLAVRPDADPLFHWMAKNKECVLSVDWLSDSRFDAETRSLWPGFKSLLAAPVMGERRSIGHIVFGHESEGGYFTSTQRRVLAGVVNLVAPAFETASMRLERTSQERLARARLTSIDY
ncbi:MAG: cyclic nucleotide-binding domain-containing protein [Elusimicrobia bacterium]|nr:cyclic nucleotide-binding domain-containing protein [Elusimicrobiota bacterium]